MRILVVEPGVAEVDDALLKTALHAPAVIEADGPGVDEYQGHVGDANVAAGLDDTGVFEGHLLTHVEVLEGQGRSHLRHWIPALDD